MEDEEIIALYFSRDENAISETSKKYGRYCKYIASRILYNEQDEEEVINDTYLKVWNTVPPQSPQSLKSYVGMICRDLSVNAYEKRTAQKRGTAEILDELTECSTDTDFTDALALKDALNGFLGSLSRKNRAVFLLRYWHNLSIAEISDKTGLGESAVTTTLLRARKKLKVYLQKEGINV